MVSDFIRDLRWVSFAEVFSQIASFVTVPLLTRALIPSEYGLYRSAFVVVSLLTFVRGVANLQPLLLDQLPRLERQRQRSLTVAITVCTIALIAISLVGLVLLTELGLLNEVSSRLQEFVAANIWLAMLLVASKSLYQYGLTVCKGLDEFAMYSGIKFLYEITFLGALVALVTVGQLTIVTAISAYAGASMLAVAIIIVTVHDELNAKPDFETLIQEYHRISAPLIPRSLVKKAKDITPRFLIISAFGVGTFGSWSVVFTLAMSFRLLSRPFSQILLPKISKALSEGQSLDGLVYQYYRAMGTLIFPAVVGGWLLGAEVIQHVFGAEYVLADAVIWLLLAGFGVQSLNAITGSVYVATDRSDLATYTQILSAVGLLSLVLLGAFFFDSLIIVSAGYLAENLIALTISLKYQSTIIELPRPNFATVWKLCFSLAVMVVAVGLVEPWIAGVPTTFGAVALGAATYFVALYATGFVREQEWELIRQFVSV
ncbi:lipopolysaccharide biosynthesis protein [Haloarcula argentinensis]|uniref:Lipopolysaccharide biosynthesis protein n=1 Tax=Haloarcula argentinensis TaxID=43776 RepID=A0A830FWM9_HALAR|nr:lipopolysaccharide biosynthesis protein [Haloarcula argentinensis]EMA18464.1 polysaccharide biosynthesis protein [Haloarcula argentinensis DSM 12282]MDS0253975.1 lipopolysaccharide biosynthesis protein [Haloarcula argentinensis]GGM45094.1 hypothetical protein GCM10009006_28150 [Haloarcula argentinensis]